MYYDLNIAWPQAHARPGDVKNKGSAGNKVGGGGGGGLGIASTSATTLADPLEPLSETQRDSMRAMTLDLADLGYSTIAFNTVVPTRFDGTKHANPFQPHPSGLPRPPFPDLDPRCNQASDLKGKKAVKSSSSHPKVVQLSRMTLVMNDESMGKHGHGLNSAHTNALLSYDLLSVRPTSEATFSTACLSLSELKPQSIDIISIDLAASARLPFFLKRSTVGAALSNGAVFEVCYSPAVSASSADQHAQQDLLKARRNVISATRDILRVTNGRGVIFSSGAADIMGLRGPYDVINLAAIFGLNAAAAKDAISSTCRALLFRAETRRTFRGVVARPTVAMAKEENTPAAEPQAQVTVQERQPPDPDADMTNGSNTSGKEMSKSQKKKKKRLSHPPS
ncbi:PHP domain-like protein [Acaromyces ingoldii]|uniref:PHP domain-like protein n=1 Tax=Acaromyces ingoldii TaxID=215250 RepID=A0A316YJT5_9BASI|nr:PHP domain-like protein [Acaromyces ingoldii]PWN88343.1 PHP domain-like protein [Acaromyces ingoldii]